MREKNLEVNPNSSSVRNRARNTNQETEMSLFKLRMMTDLKNEFTRRPEA